MEVEDSSSLSSSSSSMFGGMFGGIVPALLGTISYPFIAVTFPGWMPSAQVTRVTILEVGLVSFLCTLGTVSIRLRTGVRIHNSFFVGGELHESRVQLFYPDWYDDLDYVGDVDIVTSTTKEGDDDDDDDDATFPHRSKGMQTEPQPQPQPHKNHVDVSPGRPVGLHDNIVTVEGLRPKTYLHLLLNAWYGRGRVDLASTVVAHLKVTNVPWTVELVCNTTVNFLAIRDQHQHQHQQPQGETQTNTNAVATAWHNFIRWGSIPVRMEQRKCSLESYTGGWSKLDEKSTVLRDLVEKRYHKHKNVLGKEKPLTVDGR